MRILSVGSLSGLSNTCLHRNWALHKIADVVDEVPTDKHAWSLWRRIQMFLFRKGLPIRVAENDDENAAICSLIEKNSYDIVWIDKGWTILHSTLEYIHARQPKAKIVSYSPDNMALRHNQSQQYLECLPLYDYVVTNKSYIIDEMKKLGAREVLFVNNSYEPTFHHPRNLTMQNIRDFGGDVVFVGAWEEERCQSLCYLADHEIRVRVFGTGRWRKYKHYSPNLIIEERTLKGEDYCMALQASRISLCFLRKMNYDVQTTRTVEIPACGGFMLAERTEEHLAMFEEDMEAAYFSSNEEMLEKCRYYLENAEERRKIAQRGLFRCEASGYSNEQMIRKVIDRIYG